jgi:broad specificity phosphatase PhoE
VLLYFMRHAESEANTRDILAGRMDYPLSDRGEADAEAVALAYAPVHPIDAIIASPLLRARQTAEAFARLTHLSVELDEALVEQDMGVFADKTYAEAEADPAYERDKSRRWDWAPPGGESYRMIAERVKPFFARMDTRRAALGAVAEERILVVTHAVTLRLIVALLKDSLPAYPTALARNAEILEVDYRGLGPRYEISAHYYGRDGEAKA